MAGGGGSSSIRGSRVGAGPSGERERGDAVPRKSVAYFCGQQHRTEVNFALEAEVPEVWDCPRCGLPAGTDPDAPPGPPRTEVYKTHLAYVKERRSDEEAAELLDEAVQTLRDRRASGDLIL